MSEDAVLPVVVIGAGPVGLAAAAHLVERGLDPLVLEAGEAVGASVLRWAHVRVFSPWRFNIDEAARRLLADVAWKEPDPDGLPTGRELVEEYLRPLAGHPRIAPYVRTRAEVVGVARAGADKIRSAGRDEQPFVVRVRRTDGYEEELLAQAVIDASGTYRSPNPLGGTGLPALGEAGAAAWVTEALPDVLGVDRDRFAGRRTLVVGTGHSAATTLLALVQLAAEAPGTEVHWAIRGGDAARVYGGGAADQLPARGQLGTALRSLVDRDAISLHTGFRTTRLEPLASSPAEGPVRVTGAAADGGERSFARGRGRGHDRVPARLRLRPRAAPGSRSGAGIRTRPRSADRPQPALLRDRAPAWAPGAGTAGAGLLRGRDEELRPCAHLPHGHRVRAGALGRRGAGRRSGGCRRRRVGAAGDRGVLHRSRSRRGTDRVRYRILGGLDAYALEPVGVGSAGGCCGA